MRPPVTNPWTRTLWLGVLLAGLAAAAPAGDAKLELADFFEKDAKGKMTRKQNLATEDTPLRGVVSYKINEKTGKVAIVKFVSTGGAPVKLASDIALVKHLAETTPVVTGTNEYTRSVALAGAVLEREKNNVSLLSLRVDHFHDYIKGKWTVEENERGKKTYKIVPADTKGQPGAAYEVAAGKSGKKAMNALVKERKDGDIVGLLGQLERKDKKKKKKKDDDDDDDDFTFLLADEYEPDRQPAPDTANAG